MGNLRDNELLNVVDDLLPHHNNEELLSQFNEATARTTLQKRVKTHREIEKCSHIKENTPISNSLENDRLTSSFLIPNKVP